MRNQILIGLGGTGGKVLKAFRKRLWVDANHDKDRLPIGFICVDSTEEMMDPNDKSFVVLGKDTHFQPNEFVHIKDGVDLGAILQNPEAYPGLEPIVGNGQLMAQTLGQIGVAAGQKRRAGRILFAAKCNDFLAALVTKWNDLSLKRNNTTKSVIHIFTGLAGGTGSGAILDVVSQIRKHPSFHSQTNTTIIVHAMVPEVNIPGQCDVGRYHQNGFAALRELSAFNAGVFLPKDVLTGQTITNINTNQLYQFGLMLYSNENEKSAQVDSFEELPELVANAVYTEMFLPAGLNGNLDSFKKAFLFENVVGDTMEFNSEDGSRSRTKAVNTFGIKRVIYPDRRILDHVACTFGTKVIDQMLYNNFDKTSGYIPQKKPKTNNFTSKDQFNKWMLDKEHLMLRKPTLTTDRNWEDFDEFWHTQIVSNISIDDAFDNDDNKAPLDYLEDEAKKVYRREFRDLGVERFFLERQNDSFQSKLVLDSIEKTLYTNWIEGNLSLYEITDIIADVCSELKILRETLSDPDPLRGDRAKLAGAILAKETEIKKHKEALATRTVMQSRYTGILCYAEHKNLLKDLYIKKTELEACVFMEWLITEIVKGLESLSDKIEKIQNTLVAVRKDAQNKVAEIEYLNNQSSIVEPEVLRKPTIEVYKVDVMHSYEAAQIINKKEQEDFASKTRKFIEGRAADIAQVQNISLFDKLKLVDSPTIFNDVISQYLAGEIKNKHDSANLAPEQKFLGLNVLEQLEQLLVSQEDKNRFVTGLIESCGVYLQLDDMELMKSLNFNPNPVQNPHTMDRKAWLISIPQIPGNPTLRQSLIAELTQKMQNRGGQVIAVADSEEANEMTIMYIRYLFPIRAISSLKQFAIKYKSMISDKENPNAQEARIILHSEGEGADLPYLMGEPVLSNDDYLPYLFLASAFGYLEYGDDIEGKKGWCSIVEDEFGVENRLKLSDTFTGITSSTLVTNVVLREFMNKVNDYLNTHTFFDPEKTRFCNLINATMKQYVAREFPNPNTTDYKKYADAARTAKSLIK